MLVQYLCISEESTPVQIKAVSSAANHQQHIAVFICDGKSLMETRNSSGPRALLYTNTCWTSLRVIVVKLNML